MSELDHDINVKGKTVDTLKENIGKYFYKPERRHRDFFLKVYIAQII